MIRAVVLLCGVVTLCAPCDRALADEPDVAQRWADLAKKADAAFDSAAQAFGAGSGSVDDAYLWSVRVLDAELAAAGDDLVQRRKALEAHGRRVSELSRAVHDQVAAGLAPADVAAAATYFVAEAALWIDTRSSPPE